MTKKERADKLKSRLLHLLQDSKQASSYITEFFEKVGADYITLRIINKKVFRGFDPDKFIEKLRNHTMDEFIDDDDPFAFDEWVQDELENQDDPWDSPKIEKGIPIPPDDDGEEEWLRETLEEEHHKNRAKRLKKEKNKSHPMERLKNSKDDNVGIFPIGYVEYLEKQNDLLRKNAKGGSNGKKNTRKNG